MAKKTARKKASHSRASRKTIAISIPLELIEQLQRVSAELRKSVSSIAERCIEQYLPLIDTGEMAENKPNDLGLYFSRLLEASVTPGMLRSGVRPNHISMGPTGINIEFAQLQTADGTPVPQDDAYFAKANDTPDELRLVSLASLYEQGLMVGENGKLVEIKKANTSSDQTNSIQRKESVDGIKSDQKGGRQAAKNQ